MANKKAEDKGVALVSPNGDHQVTATSPAAVTNYVYGQGYKPKKGTVVEAIEAVTPSPAEPTGDAAGTAKARS